MKINDGPELTCEHAERLLDQASVYVKCVGEMRGCEIGNMKLSWKVGDYGYAESVLTRHLIDGTWDAWHHGNLFWPLYRQVAKQSAVPFGNVTARLEICPHQLEWRARVSWLCELESEITFDPALVGLLAASMQGDDVVGIIWDRIQDLGLLEAYR